MGGFNRWAGALALAAVVVTPAAAQERVGRITEVRQAEGEGYGSTILVDVGSQGGVAPGQTIEVRRDGKVIGYGSVETAFSDMAVANVGTIVTGASPLRAGDEVVFSGAGFQRPDVAAPPPPPPDPAATGLPRGQVLSAHDGLVLIEFPEGQGPAEVGMEVSVQAADGKERGRLVLELVNARTAGGLLVSGEAARGDVARVVARASRAEGPIDYVAFSFLGVVADLEHPTPHRAPCHVGVPVRRVMPGSPAQHAGIGRGDRVIAVDGIVVRDIGAIRERIEARGADRVQVALIRGDRVLTVDVVFR